MSTKEQQESPTPTSLSDKELQDARQVINILIMAWKNYALYPEDHVSTIKSFENLVATFDNFLTSHGNLRLAVEKEHLLCKSEIIHEVSQEAPSEDITTLLYRDGIKWLEFKKGLPLEEIASFLRIAYKYRLFVEESEGDIVTALFDEELEYIDFKAVDVFWQDMLIMDFSRLPSPAPPPEELTGQNGENHSHQDAGSEGRDIQARSIADPSITVAQLTLSDDDYEVLRQMTSEEESWNIAEDLFELLLIILENQSEQEKITEILKFISELAVATIEQEKFGLLVKLFRSLQQLSSQKTSTEQDLKKPAISRFFQDLSRPKILQLISEKLLQLQAGETEKIKALGQALQYFPPEVIPSLVPVIMQKGARGIQKMVLELIIHLSRRDITPLEKIAAKHGTEMGETLLLILNYLQGDRANEIMFRMCNAPSDKVRRKAIKELLDRDPQYVKRLFPLIDDPNEVIRIHILAAIAKHKSSELENMLLNYLEENSAREDPDHILTCYKALGRCGSDTSVPFLQKTLLDRGWNSFMGSGKSFFREGAAIALAILDTPRAKSVLQQASESRFKAVRKAFERAKSIAVSGEKQ